jgi:FAD/FMN-containing dehydrogenase/Fe-S oxidoreductase
LLERALRRELEGEVRFDALTRGIYATDASHYQIEPIGVVYPRSTADVQRTFAIARERGVPVLPRGGGTSQCGQTVGRAIVLDCSRHLTRASEPDLADTPSIEVEPGLVLDHLNARLKPHGLWFPVDPSTGSRATLGGMAGNNSAGARSIRYGMMIDNVDAMEVVLPDGRCLRVGRGGDEPRGMPEELAALRALYERDAGEIRARMPKTMRNVAGYALDRLDPARENLAQLLVGSEGTLAFFSRLRLLLSPLPRRRALGVCHFPDLVTALDSVQHLVTLRPSAIELVDHNVLRLASDVPDFRDAMRGFVRGTPGALLLVEFASADPEAELDDDLRRLRDRMSELGHPDAVVFARTGQEQAAVWSVRKAGLNIVMSMAGPRKPISFIEDCAVPLEHLGEYARRVDEIFARHGTDGTWYAHASVGCLHVRPALNLKDPDDVALVRRIAEETHEVVRAFGGTHSGEHGDGLLRSEFLETMLGARMTAAYAEVKRTLDPDGLMNPGKIVGPPRMDDRRLFRYHPGYADAGALPVVLDWSGTNGILGATERCNNNGACRKYRPEAMCPSFRVTHDERHSTRGRANALRLALSGQLGPGGLTSPELADAMALCVSCKACKRECPTGVDMARLKLEWQRHRNEEDGIRLRDRVLAALPRLAPYGGAAAGLVNTASRLPGRRLLGLAPQRQLPRWSTRPWHDREARSDTSHPTEPRPPVALFVDTFTRWFEPENARAAKRILHAGGWAVEAVEASPGERPLCCGRTYLSAGMLDEARAEASRLLRALRPGLERGTPIVGLEPSCLYTLLDEIPALLPGEDSRRLAAQAKTLTEFADEAWQGGRRLPFGEPAPERRLLVHGHCHQKAFGGMPATLSMLRRIPGAEVEAVESSCCGMAGAFGYQTEHYETSMAMAELRLLPAVRAAHPSTVIVADGTSCRAQIADGSGRNAVHAAIVMAEAIGPAAALVSVGSGSG